MLADKEREIQLATERLQQQLQGAQQRHDELCAEVTALKVRILYEISYTSIYNAELLPCENIS
jgi:hypothetical protein